MTYQELYSGLKSLGYPVAYSRFAEGDAPEPPFIVYMLDSTDNFGADGVVYQEQKYINIEAYSKTKDLQLEQSISDFLTQNNIFFEKEEYYIESEKMIEVVFYFYI